MTCARCQHDNPTGARFCNACGAALSAACPTCGTEKPPGSKFCNACGGENGLLGVTRLAARGNASPIPNNPTPSNIAPHRGSPRACTPRHLAGQILQSRAALEGERKQVTVLFADVQGSMELAERVDSEAWHGILDRFFQILTDGVHRFEGTVNQ